jgi:hypothetical protein
MIGHSPSGSVADPATLTVSGDEVSIDVEAATRGSRWTAHATEISDGGMGE